MESKLKAGVPPLLYNMSRETRHKRAYSSADDTTKESAKPDLVTRHVQQETEDIEKWTKRWMIKINAVKTQAIDNNKKVEP